MNNNKIIILATTLFLLISFIFLATVEKKQADINSKNIWMIYFQNPKDESLNFTIENHSVNTNFHWEVLADKIKIQENNIAIENGQSKDIPVSVNGTTGKKFTVSVSSGNEKKEIYKNL